MGFSSKDVLRPFKIARHSRTSPPKFSLRAWRSVMTFGCGNNGDYPQSLHYLGHILYIAERCAGLFLKRGANRNWLRGFPNLPYEAGDRQSVCNGRRRSVARELESIPVAGFQCLSRTRGRAMLIRRSRNSYILSPRRVTLQPSGIPSRIFHAARDL